jgi:protein-tyrosine phosphatase
MTMYFRNKQSLKVLVSILVIPVFLLASCNDKTTPPRRGGILEGAPNFRDLGGYPSGNGKQTVWRKVFRSQTLAQLSDGDVAQLKALGVKTVIDFRSDEEVRKEPSRLPEGLKILRLSINVGSNDTLQIMQRLMTGAVDSIQGVEFMQTANRRFATEFTSQYREFFNILLQPENYPVVFHCTAGKDRTGFAAAMLLSALDADWDTVMNDYLLTNQYLKPQQLMQQIPEQAMPALRQMWGVQPSYLNAAKEEIITRYGSIDNYLSRELNVGDAEKNKLKRYLLE